MKTINVLVTGDLTTLDDRDIGAAGSYNNVLLSFVFNEEWDGLSKRITFINAKNEPPTYVDIIDSKAFVSANALKYDGTVYFSVTGFEYDGATLIEKIVTKRNNLIVEKSVSDGQPPAPLDPDLFAQLQSEIENETTARASADTTLQNNINAETTARTTADNLLVPKITTVNGHALNANVTISKSDVGLGNVDNTADLSKPLSNANITALSAKVDKVAGKSLIADIDIERLSNTSGTNTGDQTNITGNAGTATKLATARKINNVNFDGTADITIADSTKVVANGAITAGTATKISYDTKGLITSGEQATEDDIADGTTNKKYTLVEKTKLAGIATGATVYTDTMADDRITAQKNVANGVAGLDSSGKINPAQLPNLSTIKKYGVRRAINQSSSTLERVWDSVGLVANAGVDTTPVTNNFDSIYPFSKMRDCNISIVNNKIVVNAYKGDPTYKTDGTNGQVAVEVPIFYQAPQLPGDGYEYWGVSELPLGGWNVNPDFIGSNGQILQKAYYSKYTAGLINIAGTDKLFSFAGLPPEVNRSRTSFRTVAKATDSLCCLVGLQFHDVLSTLFTVEFATLNSQSIMQGATSLPYDDTHLSILAETATNRVVLTNAQAGQYVVGQTIDIGTSRGGRQVAKNCKITSITVYDANNKSITFDGVAVNTLTTHVVYSVAWYNGVTDSVVASSGSIVSNSSGKYPCKYRGIENPWGNVYQWIDGVNIKDLQSWVCNNPALYADDIFAEPYKVLNYINGNIEGWLKTTGFDERYPFARLPTVTGGGSSTYYSDYYYKTDVGNRALLVGGNWSDGSYAGLWFFKANSAASSANVYVGARLSWKP